MIHVNTQDYRLRLHHFFLSSPFFYIPIWKYSFSFSRSFLYVSVCVCVCAFFRTEIIEVLEKIFWQKEIDDGIIYSRRKRKESFFRVTKQKKYISVFFLVVLFFFFVVINEFLMVNFLFYASHKKKTTTFIFIINKIENRWLIYTTANSIERILSLCIFRIYNDLRWLMSGYLSHSVISIVCFWLDKSNYICSLFFLDSLLIFLQESGTKKCRNSY
jgi:hypothetical protein